MNGLTIEHLRGCVPADKPYGVDDIDAVWTHAFPPLFRERLCLLCGWSPRTSKSFAGKEWHNLSTAARRVIDRKWKGGASC